MQEEDKDDTDNNDVATATSQHPAAHPAARIGTKVGSKMAGHLEDTTGFDALALRPGHCEGHCRVVRQRLELQSLQRAL